MPGPKNPKLSPKQERFVAEYVIDNNAAAAARRAGYAEKHADHLGYQLLCKPLVAEAVEKKRKELARRLNVSAERVVQELARIAFADTTHVIRVINGRVTVEETANLDDDQRAAIAEISETTNANGGSLRVKLHDKVRALELLCRHLGILNDKLDVNAKMEVESRDRELEALLAEDPEARKLAAELYQRAAARRLAGAGPD